MGNMQFHANAKLPTDVIHDILKRNHAVQMIQLVSSELYARAMKTPRVVKNIKVSEWLKIFDNINKERKSSIVKVDFSRDKYDDYDYFETGDSLKFESIKVFQSFLALPNLREINLSDNGNFCFPQFQSLCNCLPLLTALTSLDLSNNSLLQDCDKERENWNHDFFANIFKQCLKLKTLELNFIMIDQDEDEDVDDDKIQYEFFLQIITALPACKSIRALGLEQQFIKPDFQNRMIECVGVILNQLDWSSKLEELSLVVSHDDYTEHVNMMPIIEALHNCVSLKKIFLDVKGFDVYSFIDIVKYCREILNFDDYFWSTDHCLHLLNLIQEGYCKNFTSLRWKDTRLKSNGAKELAIAMENKQLPNLQRLMLYYNGFDALDIVDLMAASRSCDFLTEVSIEEVTDLLGNSARDRLRGLSSKITNIK